MILLICLFIITQGTDANPFHKNVFGRTMVMDTPDPPLSIACMMKLSDLAEEVMKKFGGDVTLKQALSLDYGKRLDASGIEIAKPSGILNGNLDWLGSEQECLDITDMKHCIISMSSRTIKKDVKLGLCLPKECTKKDVRNYAWSQLNHWFENPHDRKSKEFTFTKSPVVCTERPTAEVSQTCENDLKRMLPDQSQWYTPYQWLHNKMLDSWGKPVPDLAHGHLQWLGDKNECLSQADTMHCYAPMQVLGGKGKYGFCIPRSCSDHVVKILKIVTKLSNAGITFGKKSEIKCYDK